MADLEMSEETTNEVPPTESESVEQTETTVEHPPEGGEKQPEGGQPPEPKPEDSSVIRQMRKQMKVLQKEIAALRSAPPPEPPAREDFENDADYINAVVDHRVSRAPEAVQQGVFEQKFAAAEKSHPDFKEALEDISHVLFPKEATIALRQAVETLQYGEEILYHIAKNPDLAEEIALLPPAAFAAKLGDIHGDIRREKNQKPKPSNAPAPVKPVKPSGSVDTDYDSMSFEDFAKQRAKDKEKHRLRFVGT